MKPYLVILAAFIFIGSFLFVPDVYAQFSGSRGGGGGGRGGEHRSNCNDGGKNGGDKPVPGSANEPMGREQVEYQLNTLQLDLQLTAEQSPLWQSLNERVLALQADQSRLRNRAPGNTATASTPSGSGVKPIADAVDAARNRLTALEDIEVSSRALYQSLQDKQRVMVDLRLGALMGGLLKS